MPSPQRGQRRRRGISSQTTNATSTTRSATVTASTATVSTDVSMRLKFESGRRVVNVARGRGRGDATAAPTGSPPGLRGGSTAPLASA